MSDPINIIHLKRIACDNPQELKTLTEEYIQNTESQLQHLQTAVMQKASKNIAAVAHSISSCSAFLGITAIVPPLRELEHEARQDNLVNANQLLRQAKDQFEQIKSFMHTLLC